MGPSAATHCEVSPPEAEVSSELTEGAFVNEMDTAEDAVIAHAAFFSASWIECFAAEATQCLHLQMVR